MMSVNALNTGLQLQTDALYQQRPLRVAFFIEGMSASGVDTSTQLLAAALRAQGHHVVLFVPWKERSTPENHDTIVHLPSIRVSPNQPVYWSVPIAPAAFERLRKEHFDLIHVHTSTTVNLLAWQVSNMLHLPIVYTYHTMSVEYIHYLGKLAEALEGIVNPAIERLDRLVCNQADAIVAPSHKAERYLAQIGVKPPVTVVPNGVDLGAFQPGPGGYLQERLRIGAERRILLFVGRLNQEKRPLLLYDLFRRIHAVEPAAVLVMVGTGALHDELAGRIATDGLQESVRLAGAIPYADMPRAYSSAHLWVSTSVSEVHPMVAIESAACGLPVVAWNDPALENVVLPSKSGLLVESQSAFVGATLALLRNERLRTQMGRAAALHAHAFGVENSAQQMAALYQRVLDGARGTHISGSDARTAPQPPPALAA
jgi:1,2-diacylglycerol 3-alpha-glucosyltransferase